MYRRLYGEFEKHKLLIRARVRKIHLEKLDRSESKASDNYLHRTPRVYCSSMYVIAVRLLLITRIAFKVEGDFTRNAADSVLIGSTGFLDIVVGIHALIPKALSDGNYCSRVLLARGIVAR